MDNYHLQQTLKEKNSQQVLPRFFSSKRMFIYLECFLILNRFLRQFGLNPSCQKPNQNIIVAEIKRENTQKPTQTIIVAKIKGKIHKNLPKTL